MIYPILLVSLKKTGCYRSVLEFISDFKSRISTLSRRSAQRQRRARTNARLSSYHKFNDEPDPKISPMYFLPRVPSWHRCRGTSIRTERGSSTANTRPRRPKVPEHPSVLQERETPPSSQTGSHPRAHVFLWRGGLPRRQWWVRLGRYSLRRARD